MRLIVTADLHVNHPRSHQLALDAIEQINQTPGDALLIIGDTATADGDELERALSAVKFTGPKLFLAGNHELWTAGRDSYKVFIEELPRRIRALGWQWLETDPYIADGVAVIGSVGWYDYSFAPTTLGIPHRFYEAKVSPGAAERLSAYTSLLGGDVPVSAMQIVARWNDGKHVKLGRSDAAFLDERLEQLRRSLDAVPNSRIIAAVHHVPFAELLPPRHSATWDFTRAYLGSARMGEFLKSDPRVSHVLCGHSHFPIEQQIGPIRGINIGSGYRKKYVRLLDV